MRIANDGAYVSTINSELTNESSKFKLEPISQNCGTFNAETRCNETYGKAQGYADQYAKILASVANNMKVVSDGLEAADAKVAKS